jgi:hypothetical protein
MAGSVESSGSGRSEDFSMLRGAWDEFRPCAKIFFWRKKTTVNELTKAVAAELANP